MKLTVKTLSYILPLKKKIIIKCQKLVKAVIQVNAMQIIDQQTENIKNNYHKL